MATNGSASATAQAPEQGQVIDLAPLKMGRMIVPISGITPVIPHKWSEKALRMMREKQSGNNTRPKHEPKVPEDEAEAATYYLPDGVTPGMPATAFKASIVDAVRFFQGITMVQAKQSFFVEGVGPDQLVALSGDRVLREDTPRNATGVADLRYRYAYHPWFADLEVTYLPQVINEQSVLALINAAGMGGVGDWRPSAPKSKTGTFGRFEVDGDRQVQIVEPNEPVTIA